MLAPCAKPLISLRHLARPGAFDGKSGARRRLLAVPLVGCSDCHRSASGARRSRARTRRRRSRSSAPATLTTPGLIPNLIQPEFTQGIPAVHVQVHAARPPALAIQNAENGTGGPSALIVHAASLENQFVANGFSYNNQYGNAIFTNDFVLAGPTGDPAGVALERRQQHRAGVRRHRGGRRRTRHRDVLHARRHHDRFRHDRRGA